MTELEQYAGFDCLDKTSMAESVRLEQLLLGPNKFISDIVNTAENYRL